MITSTMKDDDFIREGISLMVNWTNKFSNDKTTIRTYHVYISTFPGGMFIKVALYTGFDIKFLNY